MTLPSALSTGLQPRCHLRKWKPAASATRLVDSAHMKDPMLGFIRDAVLNLASWPDSWVITFYPHKMSSAVLTACTTLCFQVKRMSLALSTQNPKSAFFTLLLQWSLHPNVGFAITLYHSSSPRAPDLAGHAVRQALLCSCVSATGKDITIPRLCKML